MYKASLIKVRNFGLRLILKRLMQWRRIWPFHPGICWELTMTNYYVKQPWTALKSIGINAEWTLSGEEAIELVIQRHNKGDDYQIILLDWKLPGMNGI